MPAPRKGRAPDAKALPSYKYAGKEKTQLRCIVSTCRICQGTLGAVEEARALLPTEPFRSDGPPRERLGSSALQVPGKKTTVSKMGPGVNLFFGDIPVLPLSLRACPESAVAAYPAATVSGAQAWDHSRGDMKVKRNTKTFFNIRTAPCAGVREAGRPHAPGGQEIHRTLHFIGKSGAVF